MAVRVQRKRTKGWRMPEGAIYVGRPSPWGNPCTVEPFAGGWSVDGWGERFDVYETESGARQRAVDEYRRALPKSRAVLEPLRGHDLACWCPLDQPCHADVLLELANR